MSEGGVKHVLGLQQEIMTPLERGLIWKWGKLGLTMKKQPEFITARLQASCISQVFKRHGREETALTLLEGSSPVSTSDFQGRNAADA
jgi:hypothetical protein